MRWMRLATPDERAASKTRSLYQGGLADDDEMVGEGRVGGGETGESGDEADVILARLEIANGEDEGFTDVESAVRRGRRHGRDSRHERRDWRRRG